MSVEAKIFDQPSGDVRGLDEARANVEAAGVPLLEVK